jgi:hypothetical protein
VKPACKVGHAPPGIRIVDGRQQAFEACTVCWWVDPAQALSEDVEITRRPKPDRDWALLPSAMSLRIFGIFHGVSERRQESIAADVTAP